MKALLYGLGLLSLVNPAKATWNFEIAPYLWASGLEGTEQTGKHRFHVSKSFSELIKHLDLGAMLYVTAYQNNFGLFFNGIYSKVSDNLNLDEFHIHTSSTISVDSAGLSYKIPLSQWTLEPYAGARYTFNGTKISINALHINKKYNWIDGILGSRIIYKVNSSFNIEGSADYGMGSHSNSYNLTALLGYQSLKHFKNTRFYLGYRLLHQNYHTGSGRQYFLWKMNLYGPVAGFAYRC
ncbi:MAG: hypothetical protein LCH30_02065 [Proteobacteria bacterium]|nr:hypothetical protein [Pseudomonadota bacterium]